MNDLTFLSRLYPSERLAELLTAYGAWHPYPTSQDRAGWAALPKTLLGEILRMGENALTIPWPQLPASQYFEFARAGNRSHYEAPYFQRRDLLSKMTFVECVEGKGRFLDSVMDAVWSICEESSWCLPAHTGVQKAGSGLPDTSEPVVDLFAAETAALLAWVHYLLGEDLARLSPLIPQRIGAEIQSRVLTPALERDDWGWMGFQKLPVNNWNPWINSNWLACVLLIEKDPHRRTQAVAKILRCLDRFLAPYPADGGCDEGPVYWTRAGASLFDCLELLYLASSGAINVFGDPKVGEIGRFVYRAHIDEDYYVNFADASALNRPNAAVVFGYGQRIGDPRMASFGAWLASKENSIESAFGEDPFRALQAIFRWQEMQEANSQPPLRRDAWLPEIQVMIAREREGSSQGWYLAAKGGHNAESHNHNDIGNFIVFRDGRPVIIDVGVETYTRKTFSAQRYEIWTMQSAYHSLPTIGGVMQAPGREFAARDVQYEASDNLARFSLDLAPAYPPEAKLRSWRRTLSLRRGLGIALEDRYELVSPKQPIVLSLVTPCTVDMDQPGTIGLGESPLPGGRSSGAGMIHVDPACFRVSSEIIPIDDANLSPVWGDHLTRLLLEAISPGVDGGWKIEIDAGS